METGKKKNRNVKKRERDILIAKADTPKVLRICEKQWKVIKSSNSIRRLKHEKWPRLVFQNLNAYFNLDIQWKYETLRLNII